MTWDGLARLVWPEFARRTGLEAAMDPVVLAGHVADLGFDPGVHPRGVGDRVVAGEVGPGFADRQLVALSARQHARDAGQDAGAGGARQAWQAGDRRRRDAEKRHENRVAPARVEIGQVVERAAGLHRLDRRPHAVLAREQQLVAETAAAAEQDPVEDCIGLRRVDADDVEAHRHRHAAGVEAEEMRGEKDHRAAGGTFGVYPFRADDANQALDPGATAPPEDAAFEHAATEQAEVGFDEMFTVDRRKFGKTEVDVDLGNPPPLASETVERQAEGFAERREQAQRQEMQQPEQCDGEQTEKSGQHVMGICAGLGAASPAGRRGSIRLVGPQGLEPWTKGL